MVDELQKKLIEAEIELYRMEVASKSFNTMVTTIVSYMKAQDLSELERGRLEGLQMSLEAFNKVFEK